jgi:hypothetical protein
LKSTFKLVIAVCLLFGCRTTAGRSTGSTAPPCSVYGPTEQKPAVLERLRLGMSRPEVEALLVESLVDGPAYSPIEGQYYPIGGDYWLEDPQQEVPCGIVADFLVRQSGTGSATYPERLESCWWGPIGE